MHHAILTLRYSTELCAIDDRPLRALARTHEVLTLREYLFDIEAVPHLLCVVTCRRRQQARPERPEPELPRPDPPRREPDPDPEPPQGAAPPSDLDPEQRRLYDAIRTWRASRAEEDGVPRYVVLTNKNVAALVRGRPESITALRGIPGIGKAKVERYGETLLDLLRPPVDAPEHSEATA